MVRGIVVFGGIWAATAASVTLVRYPFSEEPLGEGEVETLDPREFVTERGESPFASKYPNYFAATKKVNKKFWEDRFDSKKKQGNDKIEVDHHSGSKVEITSVWDDSGEFKAEKHSLVGFCKEGYFAKASFDEHHEWFFSHPSNTNKVKVDSDFWSLCSVFGSRPETLKNRNDDADKDSIIPYSVEQLGSSAPYRLLKADKHHAFWYIREQEWQSNDVTDSYYFGNDKKGVHTIRELCESAYSKNNSDPDNEDIPGLDLDELDKYCGLEWVWD